MRNPAPPLLKPRELEHTAPLDTVGEAAAGADWAAAAGAPGLTIAIATAKQATLRNTLFGMLPIQNLEDDCTIIAPVAREIAFLMGFLAVD